MPIASLYSGQVDGEQYPHGKGILSYDDGSEYCGYFVHGWREGFGDQQFASGDRYIGFWKADEFHGKGVYYFGRNGCHGKYQGLFKKGLFHGFGERVWKTKPRDDCVFGSDEASQTAESATTHADTSPDDGSALDERYIGEFVRGQREGQGQFITPLFVYDGSWCADTPHGQGICKYSDGTEYRGSFVAGHRHGRGIQTWNGGRDVYDGDFETDTFSGLGLRVYGDGSTVEGEFRCGEPYGLCARYEAVSGCCYVGRLEGRMSRGWTRVFQLRTHQITVCRFDDEGVPAGVGLTSAEDGTVTIGDASAGFKHSIYRESHRRFKEKASRSRMRSFDDVRGQFVAASNATTSHRGVQRGVMYYENGDIFAGEFDTIRQRPHGIGSLARVNGIVESGRFMDGVLLPPCT